MGKIANLTTPIDDESVDSLKASFRGELIRPTDIGYDEHRKVWNGSIDRRPGLIARCTSVNDVLAALRFAREHELLTAVRGGGHSFPGFSVCDGGIVIDLGPMKNIRIDPEARTVRAQPGVPPRRARSRDAGVRARGPCRNSHPYRYSWSYPRRWHRLDHA